MIFRGKSPAEEIQHATTFFEFRALLKTLAETHDEQIKEGLYCPKDASSEVVVEAICKKLGQIFMHTSSTAERVTEDVQSILDPNSIYTTMNDNFVIAMLQFMLNPRWHLFTSALIIQFVEFVLARKSSAIVTQVGQMLFAHGEFYIPESEQSEFKRDQMTNNINETNRVSLALACLVAADDIDISHLKVPCYLSLFGFNGVPNLLEKTSILDIENVDSKAIQKIIPKSYLLDLLEKNKHNKPSIACELGELYYKAWQLSEEKENDYLKQAIENFKLALTMTETSYLPAAKHLVEIHEKLNEKFSNHDNNQAVKSLEDKKDAPENQAKQFKKCFYDVQVVLPIAEAIVRLNDENIDEALLEAYIQAETVLLTQITLKQQIEQDKINEQKTSGMTEEQKEIKKEVEIEAKKADMQAELRQKSAMHLLVKPVRSSEMKGVQVEITEKSAEASLALLCKMQTPYALQARVDLINEKLKGPATMPYFHPNWLMHIYNRLAEQLKVFDAWNPTQKIQLVNYYLDHYAAINRMTRWPRALLLDNLHYIAEAKPISPEEKQLFIKLLAKLIAKVTNGEMNGEDTLSFVEIFKAFNDLKDHIHIIVRHLPNKDAGVKFLNELLNNGPSNDMLFQACYELLDKGKLSPNTAMQLFKTGRGNPIINQLSANQQLDIFASILNYYPELSQESRIIAYNWVKGAHLKNNNINLELIHKNIFIYLAFRHKHQDSVLADIFQLSNTKIFGHFIMDEEYHEPIGYVGVVDQLKEVWILTLLANDMRRKDMPSKRLGISPLDYYFATAKLHSEEKKPSTNLNAEVLATKKTSLIKAAAGLWPDCRVISPQWFAAIHETARNQFIEHLPKPAGNRLDELEMAEKVGLFVGAEKELQLFFHGSVTQLLNEQKEIKASGREGIELLMKNTINRLRAEINFQKLDKDFINLRDPFGIKKKTAKLEFLKELLGKIHHPDFSKELDLAIEKSDGRTQAALKACKACLPSAQPNQSQCSIS